ncbi:type III pantothenate kinase [Flavobacteriaceae bacterium F89]|uniref:Type III pantothenate kinase n=1 Tax=Cerina litoralis TaxID=2874477 RepID=A0AAE3EXX6_9FLAO|nr:type III pantothenate kinase [Cerina litoralis]MCG2461752.1 type III pantothenate kinase [Cerina litoralis]
MNLIIDAGNTFVKFAIFEGRNIVFQEKVETKDFCKAIKMMFGRFPKVSHAIVANVGGLEKKDIAVVAVFCKVHQLNYGSKVPYRNCYATPKTLGVDRMALATAAFYQFPNKNTLVVDAGTCITYDMVLGIGDYLGGAISPGLSMRYKALNEQTNRLPLLQMEDLLDFIGNSTESSIHSGVINGVCCEIDGVINQYRQRFTDLTVILTGGDAQFLSKRLKNTIFAHSKFLLEGLNYLLEYNKH